MMVLFSLCHPSLQAENKSISKWHQYLRIGDFIAIEYLLYQENNPEQYPDIVRVLR